MHNPLAAGPRTMGITPVTRAREHPALLDEAGHAPPPAPGAAPYTPLTFHSGPFLPHADLYTAFWGPFSGGEIERVRAYVNALTAHISGANAPAGQVPVLWQYGCRSATLLDGLHVDTSLPPPYHLMAGGAQVSALIPRAGHIDLFVTDAAGTVWSTWWEQAPGWQGWFTISPGVALFPGEPVAAITPRTDHIDLSQLTMLDSLPLPGGRQDRAGSSGLPYPDGTKYVLSAPRIGGSGASAANARPCTRGFRTAFAADNWYSLAGTTPLA